MGRAESLVGEFDHEMATTRKCLERVPEDKFGWKPHEKSMDFITLASHIAEMASWATTTVNSDELDFNPPDGPPYEMFVATSSQELLDKFDAVVVEARAALAGCSDADYMKP
jgi:hypothetical protein